MASTASLEELPFDICTMVLKLLPSKSLFAAIHASPNLRASSVANSFQLIKSEVDQKIIPIAVALYHAQSLTWMSNPALLDDISGARYTSEVVTFCKEHLSNLQSYVFDSKKFTFPMMIHVLNFHQIAQDLAFPLAQEAGKLFRLAIGSNEWPRFVKCIYIYELARIIVPRRVFEEGNEILTAWRSFWSSFAPWEVAGIELLETHIKQVMILKGKY